MTTAKKADPVKFLVEDVDEGIEFVKEGTGEDRSYFIQGPFLLQEEVNRNRRKYPRSQMLPAVQTYLREYVERNRAMGELNHPPTPTVNLDRVMLNVVYLQEDGNYWNGKAKVLEDQPMGKIAVGLLKEGIELGVSSRATGKIQKGKDFTLVTEGLRFHAIDMVADPSAHKAFVNMIMEDVDWVMDPSGTWQPMQVQHVTEEIIETGRKDAKELSANATKLFEAFMGALSNKYRDHPDNKYLTRSDRKFLNSMTNDADREIRRGVFTRARKHLAGVKSDPEAFNQLMRLHVDDLQASGRYD